MTINQCIEQLLEVENERKEAGQLPHSASPRSEAARLSCCARQLTLSDMLGNCVSVVSVLRFIACIRRGALRTSDAKVSLQPNSAVSLRSSTPSHSPTLAHSLVSIVRYCDAG